MKLISVVTPCFNEELNVLELTERVRAVFAALPQYDYEHLFIDNASTDGTVAVLREIARGDARVKVIVNRRNFGHVRSPVHGILQAKGEAVVALASDLQDPPELIPEFLLRWESGAQVVLGVKESSEETVAMFALRSVYYRLLGMLSEVPLVQHATGFGLYDRSVVDVLREINDPYPYVRGLVAELGFDCATIGYRQPLRRRGITKNNFFTLYDLAMVGITSHSKLPLRVATILGFGLSVLSFVVALLYLVYKLVFWHSFPIGIAPLVIGFFLSFSILLFFLGVLGEYVGLLYSRSLRRPLVLERERINFS